MFLVLCLLQELAYKKMSDQKKNEYKLMIKMTKDKKREKTIKKLINSKLSYNIYEYCI